MISSSSTSSPKLLPDFPHRAALRQIVSEAAENRITIENALRPFVMHLNGGDATTGLGPEWTDLSPVPARLRVLAQLPALGAGAFVGEVEYADSAELDNVTVAEAVHGLVLAGSFTLRRHLNDTAERFSPGQSFFLDHHEPHGWQCEGLTRSLLVFIPPPESVAGCSIVPDRS